MADQITNYQCPACTGPLHFEGTIGKLQCEYCGSTYTVEEIEKLYADKNQKVLNASEKETAEKKETSEWECSAENWTENGMKAYSCPSCGAELLAEENTAATACPYCGNPTIVPGKFEGVLKPEYVIPFKLDKEAAKAALLRHYKGKPFLPKSFTDGNHIEEIKGVYVPFWLYDGKAHVEGSYEASKNHTETRGQYKITTTEHYHVERRGSIAFEKIPADASTKMADDLMDSIEPYNYAELTEFSMAYMPGYLADKYDVSAEANAERAIERAKKSAMAAMKNDINGYDQIEPLSENVTVKQGKISYAMMPVWMLSTKWQDKNYLFAMNGQTGRIVGGLPIDKGKFWGTFFGIAAAIEVIMVVLKFLL